MLPTIDGESERFTESIAYQWIATRGSFSDANTGGPPDVFGNITLVGTDWTAPAVTRITDVPIWVIQRDVRFGVTMRATCARVVP